MTQPLEISIEDMQELAELGKAKIIPFGHETDSIGIVDGTHFYLKRQDHYGYLGTPHTKEDRHEVHYHD
jgi:hypothetical protein